ncbi:unnamed protein product, partial [Nesidiocoris tenuis]
MGRKRNSQTSTTEIILSSRKYHHIHQQADTTAPRSRYNNNITIAVEDIPNKKLLQLLESGHDRQHPHRYSLPFDAFCHEHDTIDHQFQYYRSYLLLHYKFRGTLLILSGLSLNTFVGASLFQPVKWHMKTVESKDEKEKPLLNNGNTIKEEDEEEEGGLTLLAPGAENVRDTCDRETSPPKSSIVNHQRTGQSSIKRQNSLVINNLKPPVDSNAQPRKIFQQDDDRQETEVKPKTPAWLSWIIRIMDLNLLKDP